MKNKTVLAFGVIAVLVVLVGVGFVLTQKSPTVSDDTPIVATDDQTSSQKSLKDLLALGQSQKCTFEDKIGDSDASGTFYVSAGKMRGDYSTKIEEQSVISHMIIMENVSYTWMDDQTIGYKITFDPESASGANNSQESKESVDINKKVDYKCSNWTEDASLFAPPSNVKFQDLSSMTAPTGAMTSGNETQDQCSACDNLTGEDKAQCRSVLNCN